MKNSSGKFPEVLGYLTEGERQAIQRCVLATAHLDGHALEIGSLNGLSALVICSVLRSDKRLICIEQGQCDTLFANLVRHGHAGQVDILNEDFNKTELKQETGLSFIFVDHSHTYDDTIAVFDKFFPALVNGGIFSFHDNGNPMFEGGTKAIKELQADGIRNLMPKFDSADSFIAFQKL